MKANSVFFNIVAVGVEIYVETTNSDEHRQREETYIATNQRFET